MSLVRKLVEADRAILNDPPRLGTRKFGCGGNIAAPAVANGDWAKIIPLMKRPQSIAHRSAC